MYTIEELETAVSQIVQTEVRKLYGDLGNRKTDLTFQDLTNSSLSVFATKINAPYYVVKLAVDALIQLIQLESEAIDVLVETVKFAGNKQKAVENISSLANARVALNKLSNSLAERTTAHASIEDVPAYQRFEANTSKFLEQARSILVSSDGSLRRSPGEARAMLGTLVSQLKESHAEILERASLIATAIDTYANLGLSSGFSASITAKASALLSARFSELEALSGEERADKLRGVVLDVLAARSSVLAFGSFPKPTQYLLTSGEGYPYADEDHPALPARLSGALLGPYALVDDVGSGTTLEVKVDYLDVISIPLRTGFVAELAGTVKGPYATNVTGTSGFTNNVFRVQLRNWPLPDVIQTVDITLPSSASATHFQIAEAINTALQSAVPGIILAAEPYATPLKFAGDVDIDYGGAYDIIFNSSNVDFTNLDGAGNVAVKAGDMIRVTDPNSSSYQYIASVVDVAANSLGCSIIYDPGIQVNESGIAVEVSSGELALRLRIAEGTGNKFRAVSDRIAIELPQEGPDGYDRQFETLTTFGWVPGMVIKSAPVSATSLVEGINQSSSTAIAGVTRVAASVGYDITAAYSGHTEPSDWFKVSLYLFRGEAEVELVGGANVFTFFSTTTYLGAGDTIVVREGPTDPNEVNSVGVISTVTIAADGTLKATAVMATPIISTTQVVIEISERPIGFEDSPEDFELIIGNGPNAGTYKIAAADEYTVTLQSQLPAPYTAGNQPQFFDAHLRQGFLQLASTSTGLETALSVEDSFQSPTSAKDILYAGDVTAAGYTQYFQLANWPKYISEQDIVTLYLGNFPDYFRVIESLETEGKILEFEDVIPIDVGVPSFNFSPDAQAPRGRIQRQAHANYIEVQDGIKDNWPGFSFDELNRRLNRMLTSTSASTVAEVAQMLEDLKVDLARLETGLAGYSANVVPEVDHLINAFLEKGMDRAVDALLRADFGKFFGLDIDEVSYAGTLQKSVREVERNDLPIRKANRLNQNVSMDVTIASYEEPDFEYNQSDIDEELDDLAIPAGSTGIKVPGGSY